MISAIQELAKEPDQGSVKPVAQFLETPEQTQDKQYEQPCYPEHKERNVLL